MVVLDSVRALRQTVVLNFFFLFTLLFIIIKKKNYIIKIKNYRINQRTSTFTLRRTGPVWVGDTW